MSNLFGCGIVNDKRAMSSDVSSVQVAGDVDVWISCAAGAGLSVFAFSQASADSVITRVEGGVLSISVAEGSAGVAAKVYVSLGGLERLEVLGNGDVHVLGFGLGGTCRRLVVHAGGLGTVRLDGRVDVLELVGRGGGQVNAHRLVSRSVIASWCSEGAGVLSCYATARVDLDVFGGGDVYVFGMPVERDVCTNGAGCVCFIPREGVNAAEDAFSEPWAGMPWG